MTSVGVIGYGYWGPNLVRNFFEARRATLVRVADLDPTRLDLVRRRYPSVGVTTEPTEILHDSAIDAVAIATPVSTHFELARDAIVRGKHVLIEKPLAGSVAEARSLVDAAREAGVVLLVDHTFVYTPAVRKIRELIDSGELGDLYYIDSTRVNLGLFQHDVNVVWDLAVHDVSIFDYLLSGRRPTAVSATGVRHIDREPESISYVTLFFGPSLIGHVHVNWLAPVKVRRTLIGGSRKMIVYDDLEPSEKIRVYDKGVEVSGVEGVHNALISYRTGDMWAPRLDLIEALHTEVDHFLACIEGGESPITDGAAGLRVVEILDAVCRSMQLRGSEVILEGLD